MRPPSSKLVAAVRKFIMRSASWSPLRVCIHSVAWELTSRTQRAPAGTVTLRQVKSVLYIARPVHTRPQLGMRTQRM